MRLGGDRVTKIFLDSRYALADGSIEIPGGVLLEPTNRVWLGEFSCVSSWDTIDSTNNRLYVEERVPAVPAVYRRVVIIPSGVYDVDSLAAAMTTALNGPAKTPGMGTYSVTRTSGSSGSISRTYTVACDGSFFKIPDEWYVRYFLFDNKASAVTCSTNRLFSFRAGSEWATTLTSTFVKSS